MGQIVPIQQLYVNSGLISNIVGNSQFNLDQCKLSSVGTFSLLLFTQIPDVNDTLSITKFRYSTYECKFIPQVVQNPFTVVYSWTVPPGNGWVNTTFVATITDGNCPILDFNLMFMTLMY